VLLKKPTTKGGTMLGIEIDYEMPWRADQPKWDARNRVIKLTDASGEPAIRGWRRRVVIGKAKNPELSPLPDINDPTAANAEQLAADAVRGDAQMDVTESKVAVARVRGTVATVEIWSKVTNSMLAAGAILERHCASEKRDLSELLCLNSPAPPEGGWRMEIHRILLLPRPTLAVVIGTRHEGETELHAVQLSLHRQLRNIPPTAPDAVFDAIIRQNAFVRHYPEHALRHAYLTTTLQPADQSPRAMYEWCDELVYDAKNHLDLTSSLHAAGIQENEQARASAHTYLVEMATAVDRITGVLVRFADYVGVKGGEPAIRFMRKIKQVTESYSEKNPTPMRSPEMPDEVKDWLEHLKYHAEHKAELAKAAKRRAAANWNESSDKKGQASAPLPDSDGKTYAWVTAGWIRKGLKAAKKLEYPVPTYETVKNKMTKAHGKRIIKRLNGLKPFLIFPLELIPGVFVADGHLREAMNYMQTLGVGLERTHQPIDKQIGK
jgi:hypothetical protein